MKQGVGKFRKQRRLLVELPGLGKAGALERKPYPPGDHGMRRRKYSEYGLRLEEKQKVLAHYCLKEKQLRRFIRQAKKGKSENWTDKLIIMLESRLDNIVFRLGFAPSIPAAQQWIAHGHVKVNGQKATISSMILKVGDIISLSPKIAESEQHMMAKQSPRLELVHYLEIQRGDEVAGKFAAPPLSEDIPFPFNPNYLTEYYSTRM